jgi:hypothetical protein
MVEAGEDFSGYMDNLAAADAQAQDHQEMLNAHEVSKRCKHNHRARILQKEHFHLTRCIFIILFFSFGDKQHGEDGQYDKSNQLLIIFYPLSER